MLEYDNLTLQNFLITSSDQEMLELSINTAEWNADIAIGFAHSTESRMQFIPPEIGEVSVVMTQMTNFTYDGVVRTPLRLEPCQENSLLDHEAIRD